MDKVQDTERFINYFEKEESLWNVVSEQYRDRNEKKQATERLSTALGLTGTLLRIPCFFVLQIYSLL